MKQWVIYLCFGNNNVNQYFSLPKLSVLTSFTRYVDRKSQQWLSVRSRYRFNPPPTQTQRHGAAGEDNAVQGRRDATVGGICPIQSPGHSQSNFRDFNSSPGTISSSFCVLLNSVPYMRAGLHSFTLTGSIFSWRIFVDDFFRSGFLKCSGLILGQNKIGLLSLKTSR